MHWYKKKKTTAKLHETVRGNETVAERASYHDATAATTICPIVTTDDGNFSAAAATKTEWFDKVLVVRATK